MTDIRQGFYVGIFFGFIAGSVVTYLVTREDRMPQTNVLLDVRNDLRVQRFDVQGQRKACFDIEMAGPHVPICKCTVWESR